MWVGGTVGGIPRSGNRIVVMFDGKQLGLIQSVRMNDDYSPEPASGIGDIHVQEYVPTMARHSLQVQSMVLNKGTLREAGITAENGDAVLQGLVFDIEVYSKDDGIRNQEHEDERYDQMKLGV